MEKIIIGVFAVTIILYYIYTIIVIPKIRSNKIAEQQSKMQEFQNKLKIKDSVLTMSGIYGTIVSINKNIVSLSIAPETIVRVNKAAIVAITEDIH
ncbi:preprotein translocase subunit YajC [Clostridium botulinum]|uniref:Preprotein translocase subunit YajC n=1 Tax=Clostridium botulinum C/D str. DC5 TaxID=1443128 RepID=A0A0A0IG50_CLOBO|nr:preprotein translocase subunit YajC [Clostridium botulinum]KEI03166.1 preprotein translocase subunit YajC [Clostridium botulinum C/D str. BKT75002]KEI07541.1 preprotein translocase subunit YajC [Clostridium botulinum C/D str. BKT2873]KGM93755.1 preprotein translocase subunit YajC [Clostridium botulinum D str. CCUG 7971]KGM98550.1 preprotein translocase subunit YajC [Clostridium botulinum C/D str. DC5]KOC49759.1 preprotein translocase subunit YajC [Clostridium botulinum]